jgi:hypothetical protein
MVIAPADTVTIYVETVDAEGNGAVEAVEREVGSCWVDCSHSAHLLQHMLSLCTMQVALLSPYVQREVLHHGRGCSEDAPIALPSKVTPEILALLLTYCRFHRASGRSDKVSAWRAAACMHAFVHGQRA